MLRLFLVIFASFPFGSNSHAEDFAIKKIRLGTKVLTVEIADTDAKRSQGLMHRKTLPEGKGMLFVFDRPQALSFWMKNTFIPLSIGFFDEKKRLKEVQDMRPVASVLEARPPVYSSREPALYALEVPRGWFTKNDIQVGAEFSFIEH